MIWPELNVAAWAGTKTSLHLYMQMLGKLRVALSPAQPNWLHTALLLTARGLTTGPMPWRDGSLQASIDVFASELVLDLSDGRTQKIALVPARTIADVYAALLAALNVLGVEVTLSPVPQELPDATPFDADHRPAAYDPEAVQRWFTVYTATAGIFDRWRSFFFGRSSIQVWWGAFDLAILLFSGKHVPPPHDRGYLMFYDLDAEMMNVGLYPGDEATAPFFYGYIFPQPDACEHLPIAPATAEWSDKLKEWVLPYDAMRTAPDPAGTLRAFLDSIYATCGSASGWDRAALSYDAPRHTLHGSRGPAN